MRFLKGYDCETRLYAEEWLPEEPLVMRLKA